MMHPHDRPKLARVVSTTVLFGSAQVHRYCCLRIRNAYLKQYIRFDVRSRNGARGIRCTLWTACA